jgi:hypothetical protein
MAMSEGLLSIREQIMVQLLERARTYVPAATRDPIRRKEAGLPQLVLQDVAEAKDVPVFRKHQLLLTVSATLVDAIDPQSQSLSTLANQHLARLIAALLMPDMTLGGLCNAIEYESSAIRYPEPGEIVLGVSVMFSVRYSIALGNPYSQFQ